MIPHIFFYLLIITEYNQWYITIKINTIKVLNSESIVIIPIKGEHLLYSNISGVMIGYGWENVCYIVNFSPGEYLLYSKVSGGKVYYIANIRRGNVYYIVNITGEGLLCGRFTIRHRHWCLLQII